MIQIRPLRLRDYDAIVAVWRSAGLVYRPRGRDSRKSIAMQLRANSGLYLGAWESNRLMGVVLATHDTRKGWINRLAVRPTDQRRGVGRRLVRAAERALTSRGIRLIGALVERGNLPSLRLFRRLGYDVRPDRYVRKRFTRSV